MHSTMEKATKPCSLSVDREGQSPAFKTQPWKQHWPPQTKAAVGEEHGAEKGVMLEQDGTSNGMARHPRPVK